MCNFDNASRHFDKNDFITRRPHRLGARHYVHAYYLVDWDGTHRLAQISPAFYQSWAGRFNSSPAIGSTSLLNCALELSSTKTARHKVSFFYASGTMIRSIRTDRFDTVLDRPFFSAARSSLRSQDQAGRDVIAFKRGQSL